MQLTFSPPGQPLKNIHRYIHLAYNFDSYPRPTKLGAINSQLSTFNRLAAETCPCSDVSSNITQNPETVTETQKHPETLPIAQKLLRLGNDPDVKVSLKDFLFQRFVISLVTQILSENSFEPGEKLLTSSSYKYQKVNSRYLLKGFR